MRLVDLLLEPTVAIVKFTALGRQDIDFLILKDILKVQDLPHLLEVPSPLGLVFERLDVILPELLFGCLVHIGVDFQHREVDGLAFWRGLLDDVAVHHLYVGLALPAQAEPFFGIRAVGQDQLAGLAFTEALDLRPVVDLSLQDVPRLLYLLHPLCPFDLGCTSHQVVHLRVIHQLLKLILVQFQHHAFGADHLGILNPLSLEDDLFLTEVALLDDGFGVDHERSGEWFGLKLILALLDHQLEVDLSADQEVNGLWLFSLLVDQLFEGVFADLEVADEAVQFLADDLQDWEVAEDLQLVFLGHAIIDHKVVLQLGLLDDHQHRLNGYQFQTPHPVLRLPLVLRIEQLASPAKRLHLFHKPVIVVVLLKLLQCRKLRILIVVRSLPSLGRRLGVELRVHLFQAPLLVDLDGALEDEVIFLGPVPLLLDFHDVIPVDQGEMAGH